MMKYFSAVFLVVALSACQTDESRMSNFAGKYQVTLRLPEAQKDLAQAKKDVEEDISEAKEQIKEDIAQAKEDIKKEVGEDSHFGKAMGNFVEGMGELAQGLTDLGKGLGKMGIDLGRGIIDGLQFKAEFKPDGRVRFGKKSNIEIGSGDGNFWEINDGKFYLWEDGDEKNAFEMKDLGGGKWDLVGEEIIFHLEPMEQ